MKQMEQIPGRPRRKRKAKRGIPNELSPDIIEAFKMTDAQWGPAMAALPSDRYRAFVLALYEIPRGFGAQTKAAKMAGFGTSTTTPDSWKAIGCKLAHDERILAAIAEEDKRRIRASAPRAIRALEYLIEDPDHKGHERAIQMVLDRVHPTEQRHVHEVHHHVDHDAEAVAHLRMLKSLDVPRAKLEEVFGFSGLSRYERMLEAADAKKEPLLIEGAATRIDNE
jgi:phage terminase small subunit